MDNRFSMYLIDPGFTYMDHYRVISIDNLNQQFSSYTGSLKESMSHICNEAVYLDLLSGNYAGSSFIEHIIRIEKLRKEGKNITDICIPPSTLRHQSIVYSQTIKLGIDVPSYQEGINVFKLHQMVTND
jgi:hypothetical protein